MSKDEYKLIAARVWDIDTWTFTTPQDLHYIRHLLYCHRHSYTRHTPQSQAFLQKTYTTQKTLHETSTILTGILQETYSTITDIPKEAIYCTVRRASTGYSTVLSQAILHETYSTVRRHSSRHILFEFLGILWKTTLQSESILQKISALLSDGHSTEDNSTVRRHSTEDNSTVTGISAEDIFNCTVGRHSTRRHLLLSQASYTRYLLLSLAFYTRYSTVTGTSTRGIFYCQKASYRRHILSKANFYTRRQYPDV